MQTCKTRLFLRKQVDVLPTYNPCAIGNNDLSTCAFPLQKPRQSHRQTDRTKYHAGMWGGALYRIGTQGRQEWMSDFRIPSGEGKGQFSLHIHVSEKARARARERERKRETEREESMGTFRHVYAAAAAVVVVMLRVV